MSETALATIPTTELALPQDATPANINEQFDDMVSSFLPRLQLFDSNSKACKKKEVEQGHYGLVVNGSTSDIGDEVKLFIVATLLVVLLIPMPTYPPFPAVVPSEVR